MKIETLNLNFIQTLRDKSKYQAQQKLLKTSYRKVCKRKA